MSKNEITQKPMNFLGLWFATTYITFDRVTCSSFPKTLEKRENIIIKEKRKRKKTQISFQKRRPK